MKVASSMELARNCVSHLRALPDKEVSQESISMLTNLIRNIVSNPENEEYRSIQTTDEKFQSYVWNIEPSKQFLTAAGFQTGEEGNSINLPPGVDISPFLSILNLPEEARPSSPPAEEEKKLTVAVRPVGKGVIKLELVSTATVLELKNNLEDKLGIEFASYKQKLLLKGKILEDAENVSELGISDKSIIMAALDNTVAPPIIPVTPEISATPEISVTFSTPAASQEIPNDRVAVSPTASPGGFKSEGGGDNPLQYTRQHPEFQKFRKILQDNPREMPEFLKHVQRSNPKLYQLLIQMMSSWCELLNDPFATRTPGAGKEEGPVGKVTMSRSDQETIDRIKDILEISERRVFEAYMACERDETMTIEFLLSQQEA